jgi:hypothetical protein
MPANQALALPGLDLGLVGRVGAGLERGAVRAELGVTLGDLTPGLLTSGVVVPGVLGAPQSWRSSRADPPRTPRSLLGSVARPWRRRAGRLAGVSFHESFWLATSAAAPVITLAIVVAIPDAANMRFRAAGAMWAAEGQREIFEVSGPESAPSYDTVRDQIDQSVTATRWAA